MKVFSGEKELTETVTNIASEAINNIRTVASLSKKIKFKILTMSKILE